MSICSNCVKANRITTRFLAPRMLSLPSTRDHGSGGPGRPDPAVAPRERGRLCAVSGEPLTAMTPAGSGNKGNTVAAPLTLWGREAGNPEERIDEA